MAIFGIGGDGDETPKVEETTPKVDGDELDPELNDAGDDTDLGGDPIEESDESSEDEVVKKHFCKGSFTMMDADDFNHKEHYSDHYLRSKGLIEDEDEDEDQE